MSNVLNAPPSQLPVITYSSGPPSPLASASFVSLSSLEFSDTNIYEPYLRAVVTYSCSPLPNPLLLKLTEVPLLL